MLNGKIIKLTGRIGMNALLVTPISIFAVYLNHQLRKKNSICPVMFLRDPASIELIGCANSFASWSHVSALLHVIWCQKCTFASTSSEFMTVPVQHVMSQAYEFMVSSSDRVAVPLHVALYIFDLRFSHARYIFPPVQTFLLMNLCRQQSMQI